MNSTGEYLLQYEYGTRTRAERFYQDQMLDHLNPAMIEFVGRMEMAFIATSDSTGAADCSFRAGPPGFLHVIDDRRIVYPEYRGNGVLASLGNITENPNIGILLVDFVRDRIGLHINGRARIVADAEFRTESTGLAAESRPGRRPEFWVETEVEEAYIHCRKHIPGMQPVTTDRPWGTDDARGKGGDYFDARADRADRAAGVGR